MRLVLSHRSVGPSWQNMLPCDCAIGPCHPRVRWSEQFIFVIAKWSNSVTDAWQNHTEPKPEKLAVGSSTNKLLSMLPTAGVILIGWIPNRHLKRSQAQNNQGRMESTHSMAWSNANYFIPMAKRLHRFDNARLDLTAYLEQSNSVQGLVSSLQSLAVVWQNWSSVNPFILAIPQLLQ